MVSKQRKRKRKKREKKKENREDKRVPIEIQNTIEYKMQ